MTRGTTPTITFALPIEAGSITAGFITFAQRGRKVFDIGLDRCARSGQVISVKLTERETLQLDAMADAEIQLKVQIGSGDESNVVSSQIFIERVQRILNDNILQEGDL